MSDILKFVFDDSYLSKISAYFKNKMAQNHKDIELERLIGVFENLNFIQAVRDEEDRFFKNDSYLRALGEMWSEYLQSVKDANLLHDDLLSRLRDKKGGDNFRGALAEVIAIWFLQKYLKLNPEVIEQAKGSTPDLRVCWGGKEVIIEVTSPCTAPVLGNTCSGNNSEMLFNSLRNKSKQLDPEKINLIFMVPYVQERLFNFPVDRSEMVEAFYGKLVYQVMFEKESFDVVDHKSVIEPRCFYKDDFTRVSAVILLYEKCSKEKGIYQEVYVLHNPRARYPVTQNKEVWKGCTQLQWGMYWEDGVSLF